MKIRESFPDLSAKLVDTYLRQFRKDRRYFIADEALLKLFAAFPSNKELEHVLLKISVLNDLYGTNIYATFQMAEHIQALDIDEDLERGSPEIVDRIANATFSEKPRRVYSFATKYCSWHDQQSYPIYDSFVEKVLVEYRNRDAFHDFKKADLRKFRVYKDVLQALQRRYGLERYSFKELDKALWLLGKEYFKK
jgi:hypothetical protein